MVDDLPAEPSRAAAGLGGAALNDRDNPVYIDLVQMVLGHADIRTTREYSAKTDDGRIDDGLTQRRL